MHRGTLAAFLLWCAVWAGFPAAAEESGPDLQIIDLTDPESGSHPLEQYLWSNRLVAVFADTPDHPLFAQQIELLLDLPDELIERDVIILTDTDPAARTPLRTRLRPRGFAVVIISKDGEVRHRKPFPWSVREISRAIDKMPLRQLEFKSK